MSDHEHLHDDHDHEHEHPPRPLPPALRLAAVLLVGEELLGPDRTDTNSLWLAERLEEAGLPLREKQVIGDRQEDIEDRLADLLARHDLVVATGGLGPTADDLTKEATAALVSRPLVRDEAILARIRERFARRGMSMPEINAKQADVIEGSHVLGNPKGTAPGFLLELGHKVLVLLPGVPSEMKAMFDEKVLPHLRPRLPGAGRVRRTLRVTGLPESHVDDAVRPVYAKWPGMHFTILASPGEVLLRFVAEGDAESAAARLDEIERDFRGVLGDAVCGVDGDSLEGAVVRLLAGRGETLATAESCTGGLVGKRITDVAGSSAVFLGGLVCYSNEAKVRDAGVSAELVERHGAVSEEVARALARGVRERFGATWGIGITGIAGPDGGTAEKPVGTVHVALSSAAGDEHRKFVLPGDRSMVRTFSSAFALDLLRRRLLRS